MSGCAFLGPIYVQILGDAHLLPYLDDAPTAIPLTGIPPRKLACGIKTATLKAPNESRWNATTMGAFAHWISSLGVGGLDVWRWDIDKTWPIDATEPWLLDVLDNFIVHGADAEH